MLARIAVAMNEHTAGVHVYRGFRDLYVRTSTASIWHGKPLV